MRKPFITVLAFIGLALLLLFAFKQTVFSPVKKGSEKPQQSTPTQAPSFDKKKFSNADPISIWVIVNKQHSLEPISFIPNDLVVPDVALRLDRTQEQMLIRQVVAQPIKDMFSDAQVSKFSLSFGSGYRSYALQKQFYNGYVAQDGQASADRSSARPGHSEHQTGLAFDVEVSGGKCHLDKCLGDTADGKWITANAYKYGFIIRYPEGKEDVTGYDYEPWHLRYVGIELATELNNKNIQTLEEFFNVTGGKNY